MRISSAAVYAALAAAAASPSASAFTARTAFVARTSSSPRTSLQQSTSAASTDSETATEEQKKKTKKDERLRMMKSKQFYRKGFKDSREKVEKDMGEQFESSIVKDLRTSNYVMEKDGVKVYLAKVRWFFNSLVGCGFVDGWLDYKRRDAFCGQIVNTGGACSERKKRNGRWRYGLGLLRSAPMGRRIITSIRPLKQPCPDCQG